MCFEEMRLTRIVVWVTNFHDILSLQIIFVALIEEQSLSIYLTEILSLVSRRVMLVMFQPR